MKILYIDPVFGISGDMTISSLLDAGCPFDVVKTLLAQIPVNMPPVQAEKRRKGALEGTYLRIGESDTHLSIRSMEEIIEGLDADTRVKQDARGILDIIVAAESKVHGVARDDVHLHELSHIDTLIDILGVAQAVSYFQIDEVYCGPIPQGRGFVRTAHGIMPNPPPATVEILSGLDVVFLSQDLELTTPTGAAILKYYVKHRKEPPAFSVTRSGYGFGTYQTDMPNVVRVWIGEAKSSRPDEEVWVIEADMDDAEMEYMGAVGDRIRTEGALDVLYFPVYMKKGRVGVRLSVTAPDAAVHRLVETVLQETTTFGLRLRRESRRILKREETVRETSFGPVRVKKGYDEKGNLIKTHIEYEDVKSRADERKLPYRVLLEALKKEL